MDTISVVSTISPVLLDRKLSSEELSVYIRKHFPKLDMLLPHATGKLLLDMHSQRMDIAEIFKHGSINDDNMTEFLGLKVLCSSIISSEENGKSRLSTSKTVPARPKKPVPGPELQKRSWGDIVALHKADVDKKVKTACLTTAAATEKRKRLEENGVETSISTPHLV